MLRNPLYVIFLIIFFSTLSFEPLSAQPNRLTITVTQGINFGTFCPYGSGGTVTLSDEGARTSSQNIVLMNSTYNVCIFKISTNSIWWSYWVNNVTVQSPISLRRNGGGGTLTLNLDTDGLDEGFSVSRNHPVTWYMGGTLTVRSISLNPAGTYSGSFSITAHYN